VNAHRDLRTCVCVCVCEHMWMCRSAVACTIRPLGLKILLQRRPKVTLPGGNRPRQKRQARRQNRPKRAKCPLRSLDAGACRTPRKCLPKFWEENQEFTDRLEVSGRRGAWCGCSGEHAPKRTPT
jgi:hypothetical protein